jgi:hypothetical protein
MSSNKSNSFLCDFGINSAEVLSNAGIQSAQVLSNAIATASEAKWKYNHNVPEQIISDSIVLSTSIGAIFVFSASVIGINWKWINQQKAEVSAFEVFNGTIMVLSAGVIFYTSNAAFKKLFGT